MRERVYANNVIGHVELKLQYEIEIFLIKRLIYFTVKLYIVINLLPLFWLSDRGRSPTFFITFLANCVLEQRKREYIVLNLSSKKAYIFP